MKQPSPRSSAQYAHLTKLSLLAILPRLAGSLPVKSLLLLTREDETKQLNAQAMTSEQYWSYLLISALLVLLGGVFAGLTLGLMGQDEVYLKVISTSGDASEQRNAKKVLKLIDRGKHWVLVTLLLSNVITNETLPIVLDRVLGGGWPAVVSSTAAIVIFGEVIPQSVCVRYGLQIGAFFTPFVLGLMYLMYPIAYPIACLLDTILGEDHGTMYRKSGLKTLVTLHRTMGVERLNNDEVTIISAVLDLKEKKVSDIMTPLKNVYTMSSDRILDEKCVEEIFNSGFSRIPIHLPNEPNNFIGMLLVRVLISYDPEDALPVSSFPLATLPETPPQTSCLNILNYFQEGKSHMVVVSEHPGDSIGALGVLTLEDVIEELIGEEIVDESDVFIDIDKAIKRVEPGPLAKRHLTQYLHSLYANSNRNSFDGDAHLKVMDDNGVIQFKPSNLASNPLETNKSFVTIKKHPQPRVASLRYDYEDDPPLADDGASSHDLLLTQETDGVRPSRSNSPNYGSNTDTKRRNSSSKSISHFKKFDLPEPRVSADLGELNSRNGSGDLLDGGSTQVSRLYANTTNTSGSNSIENMEQHSYRTGGIIESVVNVQGVSKTIIESRPYDDEEANESQSFLVNTEVPESHELKLNRRSS